MRLSRRVLDVVRSVQKVIKHDLNIVTEDRYSIHIRAGTGGNGLPRYNGRGGGGGNVYFVGKPEMAFSDVKKFLAGNMKIRAPSGTSSQKVKLLGDNGDDIVFPVPVGVEVVDENRNVLIARCSKAFQRYLIARGGSGGDRTNNFKGEKGAVFDISLHLKLRPNVGLVGFPNAGKSTLLKAFLPKKSVKIAPYPFTTEKPQMGFWASTSSDADESKFTLSIADLPGLIEGASRNRGKGHKFLKHLEYCDVLLMVIDCGGFQLSNELSEPYRTALETVGLLNCELENYDPKLARKPTIVLINKVDIAKDMNEIESLCKLLHTNDWENSLPAEMRPRNPIRFDFVVPVSAKSGDIEEVKKALVRLHKALNPFQIAMEKQERGSGLL